jgi:hypothetical protein
MKMQTIPSNRTAKVLDQITSVKCYSLSNHFSGEKVEPADFLSYLERMAGCKPRIRFDKLTGHGQVKFHSNEWYEFTV